MSQYQVIQLHDPADSSKLQFPRVPWEAIIESPDKQEALGLPITATSLSNITSNDITPTSLNQLYYNETTRKIYKAVSSGGSLVWDEGSQPLPGVLYRGKKSGETSDTLYVKSIDSQGTLLAQLGNSLGGYIYLPQEQEDPAPTTSRYNAEYAASAGVASGLTTDAMNTMVNTVANNAHITSVASAGIANNADYANMAGGLTRAAMLTVVESAAAAVTSVDYAPSAGYAGSAGGLTSDAISTVATSAAAMVSITSVSEADVASSLTSTAKTAIITSAVNSALLAGAGSATSGGSSWSERINFVPYGDGTTYPNPSSWSSSGTI